MSETPAQPTRPIQADLIALREELEKMVAQVKRADRNSRDWRTQLQSPELVVHGK